MKRGFSIPWQDLGPMIDGTSAIDAPRLAVRSIDSAEDFLESYGYDWAYEEDRRELEELRRESVEFIERDLLFDEPHLLMPHEVRRERDVRKLLLWASDDFHLERQRWAWVLIRVMHTFAHCGSYFDEKYGDTIRAQIMERFQPHLYEKETGITLGAGPAAVPINVFEIRGRKSRRSLALKLLHKRESHGTEVFDWVGVRFVTADRYDALRVVRYLRENNVINFMQIRPGRTRNTLLDVQQIDETLRDLNEKARAGKMPDYRIESELRRIVNQAPYPSEPRKSWNPNSSIAYHSVQFTCMQRIRVRDRDPATLRGLLNRLPMADSTVVRTVRSYADRIEPGADIRFLFPFELQILDQRSYELSRSGLASHAVYKERQRQRVKERLWGEMLRDDAAE